MNLLNADADASAGKVLAMFMLGTQELIIILIIVLVLFGGKKIPEIMRGLGQGMREFRKASDQAQEDLKSLTQEPTPAAPATPPVQTAAAPPTAEQAGQAAAAPTQQQGTPPPQPPAQGQG